MLRLSSGSCMLRLGLRLRLSIGSCMLSLKLTMHEPLLSQSILVLDPSHPDKAC